MEWWSLRIFLRGSEPRRRIGEFFLSRWSWSDECWFFSRQSFSGFRTHVAATAVCKTGMVYKHSRVVRTFFCTWRVHSHIRTLLMRVTHTHGSSSSRVKKVFVARVSYLSILLSPSHVSPILAVHWRSLRDHSWLDVRTFLPCLLVLKAQGMRISARAARSLAIWPSPPSAQNMSPRSSTKSLLWTATRCSLTIQTSMKSLTPRKTHTRTLDCSVFSQCLNPPFRAFLTMILLFI